MTFNLGVSFRCSLFTILLPVFFQYITASPTHQDIPQSNHVPLQKSHQPATPVNALLDELIRDQSLAHNLTSTSHLEVQNSSLLSNSVLSLLLQMQNKSGFPGNWTGLGSLLSRNRTGRGDDYGGSSYGGWGGSYSGGGGGYGGGGYDGGKVAFSEVFN
jgi:uncharacterized membrane protein YgcG